MIVMMMGIKNIPQFNTFILNKINLEYKKKIGKIVENYIFFIRIWIILEKLHLIWDFSWTWLNLGNVFSEKIYWIQWYEYTGAFGGSLWILFINIWIYSSVKNQRIFILKIFTRKLAPPIIGIALPIIFSLYLYEKVETPKKTIEVALIQPNIDPYLSLIHI